jgi:phage-related protein
MPIESEFEQVDVLDNKASVVEKSSKELDSASEPSEILEDSVAELSDPSLQIAIEFLENSAEDLDIQQLLFESASQGFSGQVERAIEESENFDINSAITVNEEPMHVT